MLAELEMVSGGSFSSLALAAGRYVAINSAISTTLYGVNRALAGESWNKGELAATVGTGVALGWVKNANAIGTGVAVIGGAIQSLVNQRGLVYDAIIEGETASPKLPAGQIQI